MQGSSARPFPIETRLIHREANYWSAFTYQWNVEGTDANLVTTPTDVTLNHQGQTFTWQFMDRTQCDKCHIQEQGYALGLSLEQLSRIIDYREGEQEQVNAWIASGFATRAGTAPAPHPQPIDSPTPSALGHQARV